MPARSRLARLQQGIVLALLALAAAWLAAHTGEPVRAVAGAVLIVFFYSLVLAVEFAILRRVAAADPAPKPTIAQLARAWWAETRQVPRVFGWRQPFRWDEVPDDARAGPRGVVFIHGFVCNRGFWTPWLRRLHQEGIPFVAVNLEPVFGSIDAYSAAIDAAVRRLADATGRPPVLVCHSMGGLAARAWLRAAAGAGRVHHVVTIGTPHHGTWLGRFSRVPNGRQMRIGGSWLDQLARDEQEQPRVAFTCWYSNCDNIVMPPSTATLPGASNRLVPGAAHVDLAFHPEVIEVSLALVRSA